MAMAVAVAATPRVLFAVTVFSALSFPSAIMGHCGSGSI